MNEKRLIHLLDLTLVFVLHLRRTTMGFVIKSACEWKSEYICDENDNEFTTLRKAINMAKAYAGCSNFFYDNGGRFYIINTETRDEILYQKDGEKVKRIKLYKNKKSKYKVIKCGLRGIIDDKYCSTLRGAFETMKALHDGWYVLVNLETNEKKLYYSNGHNVHIERDPFSLRLYSEDLR